MARPASAMRRIDPTSLSAFSNRKKIFVNSSLGSSAMRRSIRICVSSSIADSGSIESPSGGRLYQEAFEGLEGSAKIQTAFAVKHVPLKSVPFVIRNGEELHCGRMGELRQQLVADTEVIAHSTFPGGLANLFVRSAQRSNAFPSSSLA